MTDFLQRLRAANLERTIEWCKGEELDLLYASNEFAGEAGEVCNKVKKLVREERGWAGSTTTPEELAEEIADALICLDLVASAYGLDIEAATIAKFNKTSVTNGLTTLLE